MLLGGIVEVGGQNIALAVAVVGVSAPAGGVQPFLAVAGSVDVDADHKGVSNRMADTARDSICTTREKWTRKDFFVNTYFRK